MGGVHSDQVPAGVDETDVGNKYVLVSNASEENLSFNPFQSYLVAFSINRQTSPRFRHKQLNDTVVSDAFKVMSALEEKGVLPRNNAKLVEAKHQPDSCTFKGMKEIFQDQARRAGKGGVFFFHFSGHGIRVSSDQFGLAPVDFDYTAETYVTANVLNQWLHEANCKAKYVLFTIDCCYAGGIAEALTRGSDKLTPFPGLYVMAACTANEVSIILGTLGNSIFCYFLSHAICSIEFRPDQLPVRSIYDKCKKLSIALSSLLLGYDQTAGVTWKTMQPELTHSTLSQVVLELCEGGEDKTDAGVMRFSYATELYDYKKGGTMTLDDKCRAWIEMSYTDESGGLVQLREEGVLDRNAKQCIMDTVLCCMLRSVACIQLACDPTSIASANLFITAYMHVVAAIDIVCRGIEFHEREFALGLAYYLDSLQHRGIRTQELKELYDRLLANLNAKVVAVQSDGQDMTDSGELVGMHTVVDWGSNYCSLVL